MYSFVPFTFVGLNVVESVDSLYHIDSTSAMSTASFQDANLECPLFWSAVKRVKNDALGLNVIYSLMCTTYSSFLAAIENNEWNLF